MQKKLRYYIQSHETHLSEFPLFIVQFSDEVPSQIKDVLDEQRKEEEESLLHAKTNKGPKANQFDPSFEGHGVLIVAKETLSDKNPLCMGLGPSKNKVRLIPCFNEWVPPTLAKGWETGAVIEEETIPYNRWELGPCSTDGNITRTYVKSNPNRFMTEEFA